MKSDYHFDQLLNGFQKDIFKRKLTLLTFHKSTETKQKSHNVQSNHLSNNKFKFLSKNLWSDKYHKQIMNQTKLQDLVDIVNLFGVTRAAKFKLSLNTIQKIQNEQFNQNQPKEFEINLEKERKQLIKEFYNNLEQQHDFILTQKLDQSQELQNSIQRHKKSKSESLLNSKIKPNQINSLINQCETYSDETQKLLGKMNSYQMIKDQISKKQKDKVQYTQARQAQVQKNLIQYFELKKKKLYEQQNDIQLEKQQIKKAKSKLPPLIIK